MDKLGYSVIVIDAELISLGVDVLLKNICERLLVLEKEELKNLWKRKNWVSECLNTMDHETILYVTRNQANIYRMNLMYQDIACCFVNDSRIDYLGIEAQHEIPNVMQLSRVRRSVRLP